MLVRLRSALRWFDGDRVVARIVCSRCASALWIDALGVAPSPEPDYVHDTDLQPGRRAADQMWNRTSLRPVDVDVAGLYDGFSILTMMWLEALGFCERGESGAFVDGGGRFARR